MDFFFEIRDLVNESVDNLIVGIVGPIKWIILRVRGYEIDLDVCKRMVRAQLRML